MSWDSNCHSAGSERGANLKDRYDEKEREVETLKQQIQLKVREASAISRGLSSCLKACSGVAREQLSATGRSNRSKTRKPGRSE